MAHRRNKNNVILHAAVPLIERSVIAYHAVARRLRACRLGPVTQTYRDGYHCEVSYNDYRLGWTLEIDRFDEASPNGGVFIQLTRDEVLHIFLRYDAWKDRWISSYDFSEGRESRAGELLLLVREFDLREKERVIKDHRRVWRLVNLMGTFMAQERRLVR